MTEDYLRKIENLINVFALIDARHEPQQADLTFINKLGEWQVPFTLTFTKCDKEKPGAVQRHIQLFLETMSQTWQFLPRTFITSAENKTGKEEILQFIELCNKKIALKND